MYFESLSTSEQYMNSGEHVYFSAIYSLRDNEWFNKEDSWTEYLYHVNWVPKEHGRMQYESDRNDSERKSRK